MDIITNNPYRYLGVYSNSPTKERVANKGKMNAFLKVGKSVSFPLDIPSLLPTIERTVDTVAHAESELTLPMDQIRFAQFWWMNRTPLDKIAFNHLTSGNIEMAKTIWDKKNNVSSLQNRFVLSVINNDLNGAIKFAESLYTGFSDEFISSVAGDNMAVSTPLWQMLINSLVNEKVDILPFIDILENEEWKNYISEKTILPLIDELSHAIDSAKSSRGNGPESRLKAGQKLMSSTKSTLSKLRKCLNKSDIRYQTIVDKLATEILQCGIDYYNDSDDDDCATKAMKLQKYALTISVGNMTKQRCKENVDILQKVIDELPPMSVISQYRAIHEELRKYCKLPDKISYAVALLNTTKPHLETMKSIIGISDKTYLQLSTLVVNNALHNLIEEVNSVQQEETIEIGGQQFPISVLGDRDRKLNAIKSTLREAWKAILLMDKFDMEPDFKSNRYLENRRVLMNMCNSLDISINVQSSNSSAKSASIPSKKTVPTKKEHPYIAAILLSIISAIVGSIICANNQSEIPICEILTVYFSGVVFLYPTIEKSPKERESIIGCLGGAGCAGMLILLPISAHYWIYKGISHIIKHTNKL